MNFKILSVFAALSVFGFAAAEESVKPDRLSSSRVSRSSASRVSTSRVSSSRLSSKSNRCSSPSVRSSGSRLSSIGCSSSRSSSSCPSLWSSSLTSTEVCTQILEGIVYQPEIEARLYLDRISEEIKVAGPVLWTDQADGFIKSFEEKYKVQVTILNPFRRDLIGKSEIQQGSYFSTTSTANMNGSGFAVDADGEERIIYEFIVYNCNGELKYVLITMPLAEAPADVHNCRRK